MRCNMLAAWLFLASFGIAAQTVLPAPDLAATRPVDALPASTSELGAVDNATCLSCHAEGKDAIEVPGPDEPRELRHVDAAAFGAAVHAKMECVDCHTGISDSNAPHTVAAGIARPDCIGCHEKLTKTQGAATSERLKLLAANIQSYRSSFHAKPNADDETRPNATCNDCHEAHTFNVPLAGTPEREQWRLGISQLCGNCHEDQLDLWTESVHGREVMEKHNAKAAMCSDCHTTHDIQRSSSQLAKLQITENCGDCHEDRYQSYKSTYHGKITTLGYTHTAKCFNCHGGHDVEPVDSELSYMHASMRMDTCQECHDGNTASQATAGYLSFSPHGVADDFDKYPEIWLADKGMKGLLIGTFAFFWVHTILWFIAEYRDRRRRRGQPQVVLEGLPALPERFAGKHFRRFSLIWRAAHLLFALSLMILTLTGIPLFYPDAPWAKPLMGLLGGPEIAGTIHRVNAVIFAGVFFWHLFYLAFTVNWRQFRIFGPNSLIPGLQDLKDILAMFKWFFGLAPRPVFDRWTYWEKFDYWAPFWGVTIIGVSGLLMWVPSLTAQYLPGWVFSVAAIFHSEEAFLAVVFLFTVHFFNNHFRPDKFPLDRVMFTGTMSLDELREQHPLQYQRMLESGELEKHLVDPPTAKAWRVSTVLGFTLIVVGLALLTLVGIGFFTG